MSFKPAFGVAFRAPSQVTQAQECNPDLRVYLFQLRLLKLRHGAEDSIGTLARPATMPRARAADMGRNAFS